MYDVYCISIDKYKEYENMMADIVGMKNVQQQKKKKIKFIPVIDAIRGTILDVFKVIWMLLGAGYLQDTMS